MYVLDRDVEQEGEKSCALCEGGGGNFISLYKRDYGYPTIVYIFEIKGRSGIKQIYYRGGTASLVLCSTSR